MLPSGAIFKLKIHQNAYATVPDPTGEITELPDPLAGFQGATSQQRRGGKGRGREGRRKREEVAFPHFFFYNTTAQQ